MYFVGKRISHRLRRPKIRFNMTVTKAILMCPVHKMNCFPRCGPYNFNELWNRKSPDDLYVTG